eukprot:gene509-224_t
MSVMLLGLSGVGKTQVAAGLLKNLDSNLFTSTRINFNFYTDANLLANSLEAPLEKKAGKTMGPVGNSNMVFFVDDLNMPALDKYNTQSAISLIRQWMEYGHRWDANKCELKDYQKTIFLAGMNPTAGSFNINPRLQRHFWTCSVSFPEQGALAQIYSTFLNGHFERLAFKPGAKEIVNSILKAALSLHAGVVSNFRKTAANFHYEFNIRHLSGVFGGLLQAQPLQFAHAERLVRLWLHESERIYGDRLVSESDLKKYRAVAADMCKKMFSKFNFSKYFAEKNPEPLVFSPYPTVEFYGVGSVYDKFLNQNAFGKMHNRILSEYNDSNAAMDLVLFNDAMQHVARIARAVGVASGHALLVGLGGSGRQSLSRLAAFVMGQAVSQITISSTYGMNDLKADLVAMYQKAGVKDEGVMFLFTDTQITQEKFLVYLNDVLSSGDMPDLFPTDDDRAPICNGCASAAKSAGIAPTAENLWEFFIGRIKQN